MSENIQNIEIIVTERLLGIFEGVVVFLLCALMIHSLMAYKQYQFMKTLQLPGAWRAFLPLVSIFQWWDAGHVSWKWLLLIAVPGMLGTVLPWDVAAWSVLIVLCIWIGLTFQAGFNIAKMQQVPRVFGYLVFLPVVRWHAMSVFFLQKNTEVSLQSQWGKGVLYTFLSFVLSVVLWGGILYLSFKESLVLLMSYL